MFKQSSLFANVATSLGQTDLMFRTGGARMSGRTFGGSLNMKRCETMWNDVKRCEQVLSITIYHYQDTIISVNDVLYGFVVHKENRRARNQRISTIWIVFVNACCIVWGPLSVATGIVRLNMFECSQSDFTVWVYRCLQYPMCSDHAIICDLLFP